MNKKRYFRIFDYGLLLFIITMVLLFLMSLISGSEQFVWWYGIAAGIILAFVSGWMSHRLHPESKKQALTYGIVWAIMLAAILLIITIPNGTTNDVFGKWSTYLVFIGVAFGPVLVKPTALPTPTVSE